MSSAWPLLLERDALDRQPQNDVGLRADRFDFDVTSNLAENSGGADDLMFTPKASVIYAVTDESEVYLSAGKGFHSNDARGTTITIDPVTGDPTDKVSPLVDSHALELGFRTFVDRKLNVSAALWMLELDSELLFIGDAGNTEASRPSRRYGIEAPLVLSAERSAHVRRRARAHAIGVHGIRSCGRPDPGSRRSARGGRHSAESQRVLRQPRLRYFGPRPLIEDGSIESDSSTVFNLVVRLQAQQFRSTPRRAEPVRLGRR